jgi:hypothetical protein
MVRIPVAIPGATYGDAVTAGKDHEVQEIVSAFAAAGAKVAMPKMARDNEKRMGPVS